MGVYQYRYMPMGLKGAPDTFQRAMAEVEKQFSGTMILYVDDLIVVSRTEEQHLRDLEEFFQLMIKMGLKLKAEKSQIGRTRINFLGFVIENNTIQPNGEKTEAIRKFPVPKNITEVKSFLGMSGYFRKFIQNYAILAKPLTTLTQKDVEFKWGEKEAEAFESIKTALISPPILTTPRMDGSFEMHTDASKVGIAAVLLQEQEGILRVIAYASRPTTPVEQRYVAIESEALAITWGLHHYRPYIFGKR
uniref:RNA-directed DNA polymerase n=1 Tax=Caenorhabditis tropicalis TaxID=1561998 RepID=A0A1I7UDV4_9PELO